jgi:hypothetical protein
LTGDELRQALAGKSDHRRGHLVDIAETMVASKSLSREHLDRLFLEQVSCRIDAINPHIE